MFHQRPGTRHSDKLPLPSLLFPNANPVVKAHQCHGNSKRQKEDSLQMLPLAPPSKPVLGELNTQLLKTRTEAYRVRKEPRQLGTATHRVSIPTRAPLQPAMNEGRTD
ncbi:unnamed protein product [Natator depressus]